MSASLSVCVSVCDIVFASVSVCVLVNRYLRVICGCMYVFALVCGWECLCGSVCVYRMYGQMCMFVVVFL